MHIAILFVNIGNYHTARINAVYQACVKIGWKLTAIQLTDDTLAHDWGNYHEKLLAPVVTLCPLSEKLISLSVEPYTRYTKYSKASADRLSKYLDQLKPNAICIPGWSMPITGIARRWCKKNQAISVLLSESSEHDFQRKWPIEQYKRLLLKKYSSAVVGGKSHKRYLIKLGMNSSSIFKGYDIVDNDYFAKSSHEKYPLPHCNPYFLAISRFIPKKNLLFLLSAYSHYCQQTAVPPWDLVLCGDGPQEREIEEFINSQDLMKKIILPGFLKPDQLLPYFKHAKCFVHASTEEQWGLVINEAMASSLPVLVSNWCGCYEDLVNESINGFGFDPTNQEQLTNLMLRMSSGELNLKSMGKRSRQHIQNYSPETFAQGIQKAIKYAIQH